MRTFIAVLIATAAGCDRTLDRPIHFVVPDEFSGPFVIVSNSSYADVIEKYSNRYELAVPSSGIIRTKSIDIFCHWHKTTAAYQSGKPFPTDKSGAPLLYGGPTSGKDNKTIISWYYVGPYDEFKVFMYDDLYGRKQSQWLRENGVEY